VIATAIPEVKAILEQYKCGICFKTQNPKEMADQVLEQMENNECYQKMKENTAIAAKDLCWEKEKNKLIYIYQPFL
jgi:glycosyltransferase involved in cell wall biosynthesis